MTTKSNFIVTAFVCALASGVASAEVRLFRGVEELFNGDTVAVQATVGDFADLDFAASGTGAMSASVAGPAAGDYQFTALPIPAGTLTIGMNFVPAQAGARVAQMTVSDSTGDSLTITLSGTAIDNTVRMFAGVEELFDGDTLELEAELGDVANVTLQTSNTAGKTVVLAGPDAARFGFSAIPNPQANFDLSIALAYEPLNAGFDEAELRILDGNDIVFAIDLAGTGIAVLVDCNFNGVDDTADIASGTSEDCNVNGTPDECEIDTDQDGVINGCDQCPGEDDTLDANQNGTPDCLEEEEDIVDCNFNGVDDSEDLADGTSEDCNVNGTPDECEIDADQDGVINGCDQCPGEDDTVDANQNGTPDCLEEEEDIVDCNLNGTEDATDLANGTSDDCNSNGLPDECELDSDQDGIINGCDECPGDDDTVDANQNGTPDCLETGIAINQDCNQNDIEDAIDLVEGTSDDCNGNGMPDECELDSDRDGVINGCDACPGQDDRVDVNGDGIPDCADETGMCGAGTGTLLPLMLGLMCVGCGRRRRN